MEDWKCVYTTEQEYKAELVKGFLTNENIEAVVYNKKDSAYVIFGHVKVYVQPENENLAVELIKDFKN
jgi:hypothetical protein